MTGDAATAYAKEVVASDFEESGDADVVRKVLGDLTAKGVAVTEPKISREDGRADGHGRHAGEGGNVRSRHSEARVARTLVTEMVADDLVDSGFDASHRPGMTAMTKLYPSLNPYSGTLPLAP